MYLQTIIKEAHQEWKENPQKAKEEQEVISKYGEMFNPKNIDTFNAYMNICKGFSWSRIVS